MQTPSRTKQMCRLMAGLIFSGWATTGAYALDLKPEEIRGDNKKNPVSVLQNRYFIKSFRPEIGVAAGSFVNDAYTDTFLFGARASLFFSEWFGVEFQSIQTQVNDSDDRKALNDLKYRKLDSSAIVSPDPEVNAIHGVVDANAIFAPFYGKLNLMDKFIIYSDLYFTGGVSQVSTDQGDLESLTWGLGQRFYLEKSLSFRIDVRDRAYREIRNDENYTRHSYSVDFGMSYFFF